MFSGLTGKKIWLLTKNTEKILDLWVLLFPSSVNLCHPSTFCLYNQWYCIKFLALASECHFWCHCYFCKGNRSSRALFQVGHQCYSVLQLLGIYDLRLRWSLILQANRFFCFLYFFLHHSLRIMSSNNLQMLLKHCRSVCSGQEFANVNMNKYSSAALLNRP